MNLSIEKYLFLSLYAGLPLSALLQVENDQNHPFLNIEELKSKEILNELKKISIFKNRSIKTVQNKTNIVYKLIKNNILNDILENLKLWKEKKILIIPFFDDRYPNRLKIIKNPPKVLFIRGNYSIDYQKAISIIGTRIPTEFGQNMAKKIGSRFAENGYTIVNGFAIGIDIQALRGGYEVGGNIIGVLGSGILNIYPKKNVNFFNEIIESEKGFFISEQLPNAPPKKSNLAIRNRISSALSLGNIFIEGEENSGTRWQLKFGKEQNKIIIILKPQNDYPQAQLINFIIKNEKNVHIIKDIEDIDEIINYLKKFESDIKKDQKIGENTNNQKKITDY